MIFIRSLLFSTGMIISTFIHSLLSLCLFWLPFRQRYQFITQWSRFIVWWLKVTCKITYKIIGEENIPQQPCIIAAKHASTWETVTLQRLFMPQVTILKKELLQIPFFGWGLRMLQPIAIDRNQGKKALKKMIAEGQKRLDEGCWIVIFPEGTRVPHGETKAFNIGAAMLSQATSYPILPIAHNAGQYWPKKGFLKRPGEIRLVIGEPVDPNHHSTRQINQQIESWINKTVAEVSR